MFSKQPPYAIFCTNISYKYIYFVYDRAVLTTEWTLDSYDIISPDGQLTLDNIKLYLSSSFIKISCQNRSFVRLDASY